MVFRSGTKENRAFSNEICKEFSTITVPYFAKAKTWLKKNGKLIGVDL